jgi:hypothetical protein
MWIALRADVGAIIVCIEDANNVRVASGEGNKVPLINGKYMKLGGLLIMRG